MQKSLLSEKYMSEREQITKCFIVMGITELIEFYLT